MKSIGKRIRELRQRLGLTQMEFGALFHVSKQAVHSWENDINIPDVNTLIEIAGYCRVPICELLDQPRTYCRIGTVKRVTDRERDCQTFTDKEIRMINRVRSLSPAQRKAIEVILGIRRDDTE